MMTMSESHYIKIFSGGMAMVKRIQYELESVGITPIIKDEGESQRLAGYGSLNQGYQDVVVHEDELEKAQTVINRIKAELESSEDLS
jgi:hypothetical protein